LTVFILFSFVQITVASQISCDKSDFAPVYTVIDDAAYDIRYYSSNNFTGNKIRGYKAPVAYMTKEALQALSVAADDLRNQDTDYLFGTHTDLKKQLIILLNGLTIQMIRGTKLFIRI